MVYVTSGSHPNWNGDSPRWTVCIFACLPFVVILDCDSLFFGLIMYIAYLDWATWSKSQLFWCQFISICGRNATLFKSVQQNMVAVHFGKARANSVRCYQPSIIVLVKWVTAESQQDIGHLLWYDSVHKPVSDAIYNHCCRLHCRCSRQTIRVLGVSLDTYIKGHYTVPIIISICRCTAIFTTAYSVPQQNNC